jgi:hypothetical protein
LVSTATAPFILHVFVGIGSVKPTSCSSSLCPLCLALLIKLSTKPCPGQLAVGVAKEKLVGVTFLPSWLFRETFGCSVWLEALQADHLIKHCKDSPLHSLIALSV